MPNIYDAADEEKRQIIELENEDIIYKKRWKNISIDDLVLVRETNFFPTNGIVLPTDMNETSGQSSSHWTLNGIKSSNSKFIIIEPFSQQSHNPCLVNVDERDTWFEKPIELSDQAIILMSVEEYERLCKSNLNFQKEKNKYRIFLYRGNREIAFKMLMYDKSYMSFDIDEYGFVPDEYGDSLDIIHQLKKVQMQIVENLQQQGVKITYGRTQKHHETENEETPSYEEYDQVDNRIIEDIVIYEENIEELSAKMITGLTSVVEGDIELGETCYASTQIGKRRKNQEDAVLLIKDKSIPEFKMMVVADGMGGEKNGEIASNLLAIKLKDWFNTLDKKEMYFSDVSLIVELLENTIQQISLDIDWQLYGLGGTTLVCAIIGKDNTLIMNVGDSRGYIISEGKLKQISVDDAIVQEEYEKGNIPFKDAMRFHREAAGITQYVGMGKIDYIHSCILNNDEYEMILLFSDGVTDCLSEDDIAVICKETDRKKTAKLLTQKSVEHDSIAPQILYEEYADFNLYIPGGKDNSTTAVYVPEER